MIAVNERPTNCGFTGWFWTVCAYDGLGGFGRAAQQRVKWVIRRMNPWSIKGMRWLPKYKLRLNFFLAEDNLRSTSPEMDRSLPEQGSEGLDGMVCPWVEQWVGGIHIWLWRDPPILLCNPGWQNVSQTDATGGTLPLWRYTGRWHENQDDRGRGWTWKRRDGGVGDLVGKGWATRWG